MPLRKYEAADGHVYRVTLMPLERSGVGFCCVHPRLNRLVFECEERGWTGSAPIYHLERLWTVTEEEMGRYWLIAVGRG